MKKILFIATLFMANTAFAQSHVFYKNKKGIFTAEQVDSMLAALDKRMHANELFADLTSVKEITGEFRSGDTLFYTFNVKGVNLKLQKKNEERRNTIISKPLPEFSFTDINGKKISSSDFSGKAMVLNLWFTSCAPCIKEMPDLNKFKDENPDIAFVAMTYEDKETVTTFLNRIPFSFQHIAGVKGYVDKLEFGYPTTLFIDKKGIVQDITVGATLTGLDHAVFNNAFKKIKS
jgi:thiol-disulfide isomerase/thioredoxin